MQGYERDPRSLAKRAEAYLKSTGIADSRLFGPENEFFIFDSVRFGNEMQRRLLQHRLRAGRLECTARNTRTATRATGPASRAATSRCRRSMHSRTSARRCVSRCEEMGLKVEVHHHEVATGGQCEIGIGAGTLVKKADQVQILKYARAQRRPRLRQDRDLHAEAPGRRQRQRHARAPVAAEGRQGAVRGRQVRRSFGHWRSTTSAASSSTRKALNAFTNAGTNSYKRLVPGFEAPVMLAYSARNRSASIRIPWVSNPKARRIEVRFPDSAANPYFAFAAMMMAGLDGIQNKIHPGDPADKDLYDLEPEEAKHIPTVCHSLDMALEHLDKDREFLTRGGVFTNDVIDAYMGLKHAGDHAVPHVHAPGGAGAVLQLLTM